MFHDTNCLEILSLPDFTSSTAALLLPYISLFAQLGLQTGSGPGDLISIFVSIGAPVWTCSSIGLTILFRRAIRKKFDRLRAGLRKNLVSCPRGAAFLEERRQRFERLQTYSSPDLSGSEFLEERYNAAQIILQSFLQSPVRLSNRYGFLRGLVESPENHWWWIAAAGKIKAWRRRMDSPFIAQCVIAVLAWFLAIVADFWSVPGQSASPNSAEWQICMGTLWLWVVSKEFRIYGVQAPSLMQK